MLLGLEEIQRRLDEMFQPLEPELTGLRLIAESQSPARLKQCESALQVVFPATFKRLVLTYDFGRLTIGPTSFGDVGDGLVRLNSPWLGQWWGSGSRPSSLLMVAVNAEFGAIL